MFSQRCDRLPKSHPKLSAPHPQRRGGKARLLLFVKSLLLLSSTLTKRIFSQQHPRPLTVGVYSHTAAAYKTQPTEIGEILDLIKSCRRGTAPAPLWVGAFPHPPATKDEAINLFVVCFWFLRCVFLWLSCGCSGLGYSARRPA